MVFQVLEHVACGAPSERIVWSWRGQVSMPAITEVMKLASEMFRDTNAFAPPAHPRSTTAPS